MVLTKPYAMVLDTEDVRIVPGYTKVYTRAEIEAMAAKGLSASATAREMRIPHHQFLAMLHRNGLYSLFEDRYTINRSFRLMMDYEDPSHRREGYTIVISQADLDRACRSCTTIRGLARTFGVSDSVLNSMLWRTGQTASVKGMISND